MTSNGQMFSEHQNDAIFRGCFAKKAQRKTSSQHPKCNNLLIRHILLCNANLTVFLNFASSEKDYNLMGKVERSSSFKNCQRLATKAIEKFRHRN